MALLAVAGCGDPAPASCRADGDCAAGEACAAGVCRPVVGEPDLLARDGGVDLPPGPGADLAGAPADGKPAPDAAPSCSFDGDGVIERAEAPFVVGLGALYAVNQSGQTVTVSTVAQGGVFDYAAPTTNERKVFDELLTPAGKWWAKDFPGATFAEKLDDGQPLYGVYRATSTALQLLGVASEADGFGRTELTYAKPIDVLRFPLQKGDHWTADSDVTGTVSGVLFAGHDAYTFAVDARATTKVPAGSYDTLRLRIDYRQTVGFAVTTRITYLHLAECYGAVARVRSRDNEASATFTQAAEYRRLAVP